MKTELEIQEKLAKVNEEFREYALKAEKYRENSHDFNYQMAEKKQAEIVTLEWALEN